MEKKKIKKIRVRKIKAYALMVGSLISANGNGKMDIYTGKVNAPTTEVLITYKI